jgi:enediyne biosynthesis protein E4
MYSGWGLKFFDFDLDGDQDLIVCNGHPDDRIEAINATLKHHEPLLLFENRAGKFADLGAQAGAAFTQNYPARGLAVGDLNNDGCAEIVVANNGAAPLLLRHSGTKNHWLGLQLSGNASGARLTWSANGVKRSRLKTAGGEVRWPNGHTDRFQNVAADRYYKLKEGGKLQ